MKFSLATTNLRNINKKIPATVKRVMLLVASGLVILALSYLCYLQYQDLEEKRAVLNEEKDNLIQEETQLEELKQLREKEPVLKEQLHKYQRAVPLEFRDGILMSQINEAMFTGGEITDMNFIDRDSKEEYIEKSLHLAYEGRFLALVDFINDLEEGSRAFRIDEIDIYEGGAGSTIRADLYLSAFIKD